MLLTQALLMRGDFDRRLNTKGMVTLRQRSSGQRLYACFETHNYSLLICGTPPWLGVVVVVLDRLVSNLLSSTSFP